MNQLPATGYLRLKQIIGNKKTNPPITPIIPIGKTLWWQKVKEGQFPQPIKLSSRITVWRVEDIRQLLNTMSKRNGI